MKLAQKTSSLFTQYKRVWRLLKKPSMDEFKTISKVTAIGLVVIGALGFAINLIVTFLFNTLFL